jgi:hypothetical protein
MHKDLTELRIRLECHFDIIDYECQDEETPNPLGTLILSAIDLLKILETGQWKTVADALKAWESRGDDGSPKPRVVS